MTNVYFIRHAEAEGNLYRRIHGHYDSILTENGYLQLQALKKRFADISLDAIYSSDLFRARKTAEVIAEGKNLTVTTHPGLREICLGAWEDRPWGEMEVAQPEAMQLFRESSAAWSVPGGERFADMQARVLQTVVEIVGLHPDQTICIASHGMAMRFLRGALMGLSLDECRSLGHSDNTAVSLLEVEGDRATVVFADDNSHLSPDISTLGRQKWWKKNDTVVLDENLRFEPMDLKQFLHKGLYLASRQEGWMDLNRDMGHFWQQPYLEKAEEISQKQPKHLLSVVCRNTIVGILQLDAEREAAQRAGYISFFYMLPEYRGSGLGVQMLGEAVSVFRPLGFDKIRLSCGADNLRGMRFYERHGFRTISSREESFGPINLLEKYIGYDVRP